MCLQSFYGIVRNWSRPEIYGPKIPFIGMANILADKLVVQEYIQAEATAENLAQEMRKILDDVTYRKMMQTELAKVKDMLGGGGAHQKAAQSIADCVLG